MVHIVNLVTWLQQEDHNLWVLVIELIILEVEGRTVATNHAWGSAFRGYGSPQSLFASEVMVDELAAKMGIDPLEFRYNNVYREGDTTPTGCAPDVIVLPQMLDTIRPYYKKAKETC